MKTDFKVRWADVAELDLIEIVETIAEDNLIAAKQIFKKITQNAERLCRCPEKYRLVPELLDQGITAYRELIVAPWRIIYKIEKQTVVVLTVIDGRRNIEDILLQRLTTR